MLTKSVLMVAAIHAGIYAIPRPVPVAVVAHLLGDDIPRLLLYGLAATAHLTYGGLWAAALVAATSRHVTVEKGLGLGLALWLVMNVAILPWIGWGIFGRNITPMIGISTLILHLIYGALVGYLMDRNPAPRAS